MHRTQSISIVDIDGNVPHCSLSDISQYRPENPLRKKQNIFLFFYIVSMNFTWDKCKTMRENIGHRFHNELCMVHFPNVNLQKTKNQHSIVSLVFTFSFVLQIKSMSKSQ